MAAWMDTFEHSAVTDENREAFGKAMGKYETLEDAVVGGFNAQKAIGAPFRLPESMDKLDEPARNDLSAKARKLLGLETATDAAQLKDVDFGEKPNEAFVGKLKEWAVAEGIDKATLGKLAKFYNGPLGAFVAEQQEQQKLAQAKACNEALIKAFGSEEKVKELTTLMARAIKNNSGLSAEEIEEVADTMADSMLTKNPAMARAMLNLLAPLAQEGSTEVGKGAGGGKAAKVTPYNYKKALYPASESLWGRPEDTWDGQSVQFRQRAIKEGILPAPE